jgi:hypothetical protein
VRKDTALLSDKVRNDAAPLSARVGKGYCLLSVEERKDTGLRYGRMGMPAAGMIYEE